MKKIPYSDILSVPQSALMKQYKITPAQFEQQVRSHAQGAPKKEIESYYREVFRKDK